MSHVNCRQVRICLSLALVRHVMDMPSKAIWLLLGQETEKEDTSIITVCRPVTTEDTARDNRILLE